MLVDTWNVEREARGLTDFAEGSRTEAVYEIAGNLTTFYTSSVVAEYAMEKMFSLADYDIELLPKETAVPEVEIPKRNSVSAFGEISEGDPQKYLDFQMNGSREGLKSVELKGIAKVDEKAALNRINYDDVLEVRKSSREKLVKGGGSSYGIVNGKTPASRLADKFRELPNPKRPNTVAVIRTVDGKYYVGYNKAGIYNGNIQKVLDYLGNNNLYNRQCAEVNAISRAFNDGVDLRGATISIANVRKASDVSGIHGTYKVPCDVCQPLIDFFGIEGIKK